MEKCDCCGLWEWSNQVIQRRNGKTGCPGQRSRAMGHSIRRGLRQWNGQFAVNCINKSNNSLMRKKINPCWNTQVLYYIVVSLHTFQLLQFHWIETKCVDCVWPKKVCFISQALPHQTREHSLTFDISLIFPLCIPFVILVRLRSKFISSLVSLILWSLVRCCHIDKKKGGITQSFNSTLSKKINLSYSPSEVLK